MKDVGAIPSDTDLCTFLYKLDVTDQLKTGVLVLRERLSIERVNVTARPGSTSIHFIFLVNQIVVNLGFSAQLHTGVPLLCFSFTHSVSRLVF